MTIYWFREPRPETLQSVPNPSTAEIIFKLAATLGPMAPYIGGRNSPMGRMIGAGSVLAGGVGGVGADILAGQRNDPVAQKMRLAQQIQAMGMGPGPAALGSPEAAGAENAALAMPGATPQSVVSSRQTAGPPVFNPNNLSPGARLVAESAFPSLSAEKIAAAKTEDLKQKYYQQQLDEPRSVADNVTLVSKNDPNVVIRPPTLSIENQERQRLQAVNKDFLVEVQGEMKANPGMSLAAAGKLARNRGIDKYGELPANTLINAEITNERELNEQINKEIRIADINNRAAAQRDAAALARQERSIIAAEGRAGARAAAQQAKDDAKLARLLRSEQADITKARVAVATVDSLRQAYDNFTATAPKGCAMSDTFKGAVAQSANAQRIEDMFIPTNAARNPAEVALAAEYNAVVGSLRSLTSEKQLSNEDAIVTCGRSLFQEAASRSKPTSTRGAVAIRAKWTSIYKGSKNRAGTWTRLHRSRHTALGPAGSQSPANDGGSGSRETVGHRAKING